MNLSELRPAPGSVKENYRKGRGHASGNGTQAGKGHKGQNARTGGGVRPGFEGGQMPLYRRLPKRGFTNIFANKYIEVKLSALNVFEDDAVVTAEVLKEKGLSMPSSIKDLTKPEFKDLLSIPNIMDSSTAWLLVQAIISEYGTEDGLLVMRSLINNAGAHIESSGSGPIKKVRAGEVAAGFGLRHQAVKDNKEGLPIDYIDPTEGNFTLTESVAVVDKDKNELAMKMAEVLVNDARKDLIVNYPVVLYEGETVSEENKAEYGKSFSEPLTVKLLEEQQNFFKKAKGN